MILSVQEARNLIDFPANWTDEKILRKLKAVEQTVRSYTNNNFQVRSVRGKFSIDENGLHGTAVQGFLPGDTVQISGSMYNDGLYVIYTVSDNLLILENTMLFPEPSALVTKIHYPDDVVSACINLMEWETKNRAKVGVQSETLSRHSVTYYNMGASDQIMGYPVSLLGCLKAYRKARF